MADAFTRDAFYDSRLILTQPAKGHRSGTDAVLLAAAVPRDFAGLCYDVGSGVGAAGLGVALDCPAARVTLIEVDPEVARLAEDNTVEADLRERVTVLARDALSRDARRDLPRAELVITNPPFRDAGRVRVSPSKGGAHVLEPGVTTADWIAACLDLLAPKGMLIVIHLATEVPAILAALERRAGGITVKPIQPEADRPAHRVLVRAVHQSRAPFALCVPLILHDAGRFTDEADLLHRGCAAIAW